MDFLGTVRVAARNASGQFRHLRMRTCSASSSPFRGFRASSHCLAMRFSISANVTPRQRASASKAILISGLIRQLIVSVLARISHGV
jgi:hypothetical protein